MQRALVEKEPTAAARAARRGQRDRARDGGHGHGRGVGERREGGHRSEASGEDIAGEVSDVEQPARQVGAAGA